MTISEYTKFYLLNIFSFFDFIFPSSFLLINFCIFMYHRVVPDSEYKNLSQIWKIYQFHLVTLKIKLSFYQRILKLTNWIILM